MTKADSGWGGARRGSGRKSIDARGNTVRVTVTLTRETFKALKDYAESLGTNVADAVRTIIAGRLS
jgi:hypothetical protein